MSKNNDQESSNNDQESSRGGLTMVWFIGACSCWYHGVGFWVGLFWPWNLGYVFLLAQ
jgi:hypothetical protein